MICSECPKELTALQVARRNVTCGRTCGAARHRRVSKRLERFRQREAAVRDALLARVAPDGFEGYTVPIQVAVEVAMEMAADEWLRGYDARLHQERRV